MSICCRARWLEQNGCRDPFASRQPWCRRARGGETPQTPAINDQTAAAALCAGNPAHTSVPNKRFLAHSSPVQRSCGSLARHAGKFVRTFCRARVIYAIEVVLTTQVADRQYVYTGRCFRHRVASDSEQGTHNLRSVLLTSCLSSNAADQIKSNRAKQGRAMLRRARILLGGAHRAVVNLGVALAGAPLGAHVRAAWHVNRVSLVTRRRVC